VALPDQAVTPSVTPDASARYERPRRSLSAVLEGPGADRVLRRLTELDLDRLPLVGQLAHIRALVARQDEDRFLLVFPQEFGHYLWEVVVDAAEPLGGGPVGTP
jgi:sarcosine oxidase gamma subunit